jgi:glutathione S-transferase
VTGCLVRWPEVPTGLSNAPSWEMMIFMNDIRLHYFDIRGLGEPIRLLLAIGGIQFEDLRYSADEYAASGELRASLPFGQMPALEVDGVFLAQTDSLMRFAARLARLYPHDTVECRAQPERRGCPRNSRGRK